MVNVGRTNRTVIKMCSNRTSQKSKAGLRNGAISLTLGVVSMILVLSGLFLDGSWLRIILASPPLAIVGLLFGAIGLKSTGKGKCLAVAGIVVCSLALVASLILLFTGGWYYISTDYRFW